MSRRGAHLETLSSERPGPLPALGQCRHELLLHTQLTVRLFIIKSGKRKVDMYEGNLKEGRKKRLCFSLSILILFQPTLSGVQTVSKQMSSWQWQLKHPLCQRQERTVTQTKSVFSARGDASGCLLSSMKAAIQQCSRAGQFSAGLAGESRKVVLLALVQAAVLSLLSGVRGSGNLNDLMESLGTVLSTEKCENHQGFPGSCNSDWDTPVSERMCSGWWPGLSFCPATHGYLSGLVFRQLCV